jgi:flagellar hook-associated protein 1 FlgK
LWGNAAAYYPNLTDSVTISFNGAPNTNTYNVVDNTTGTTLASNVAYVQGGNISYNGWTTQITGSPNANDTFSIGPNQNATGDSRNGLAIAGLSTAKTLDNSSVSIQGAYAQLVSTIGNQAGQLQATSTAANTELTNATNAQQSVSGVNLDEEATKLIQYQQAYQAAAQTMTTANTLFTTLITDLQAAG